MTIDVRFTMEKATKNTIRFEEVLENDLAAPKIGSIYNPKSTLGEIGWNQNKELIVTITVDD